MGGYGAEPFRLETCGLVSSSSSPRTPWLGSCFYSPPSSSFFTLLETYDL
jgi:hypothetical protein